VPIHSQPEESSKIDQTILLLKLVGSFGSFK
jgi:hypothetical protein